jgi:signal transduction histidine kinase
MHDIVAHHLTVMVAVSDGAVALAGAAAGGAPQRSVEAMRTVSSVGREALRDTRRLLGVLRSDTDPVPAALEPLPNLGSLDDLVEQVRHTGLAVKLIVEGAPAELPAGVPLTVYRLVQEALTNTLKHASSPTLATVRLRHAPGSVLIEVTDDGEPTIHSSAGHGLTGMRERVHAWGGSVTAGPVSPQGWRVRAELFFEVASVPA